MSVKPDLRSETWPIQVALQALLGVPALSPITTDFVRSVQGALRARDVAHAVRLADAFDPSTAVGGTDCEVRRQAQSLVVKVPFSGDDDKRRATATEKFFAAERRCRSVNKYFRALRRIEKHRYPHYTEYESPVFPEWVHVARKQIRRCIGDLPPLTEIFDSSRFGPGVAIGITGDALDAVMKCRTKSIPVTPAAVPYVTAAYRHVHGAWALHYNCRRLETADGMGLDVVCYDETVALENFRARLQHVHANKVTFVPKNSKTFRTIGIEPIGNSLVQLGVDQVLKRLLQKWGVNLEDQTRNQRAAYLGSLEDHPRAYATIDLSAASDSLSTEVVRALLPYEWFSFLNAIRSHSFTLNGKEYAYEKFCSMGNGFCFPLETLIFTSVCRSIGIPEREYAVYGDDIIVPQSDALLVIERLKWIGFKTNVEKTFVHGPFRESCGKEYYNGTDITPFKLDETPVNHMVLAKLHNSLVQRGYNMRLLFDKAVKHLGAYHVRPLELADESALLCAYWLPLSDMLGDPRVRTKRVKCGSFTSIQVSWSECWLKPVYRTETRHVLLAALAGAVPDYWYRSGPGELTPVSMIPRRDRALLPLRRTVRTKVVFQSFQFPGIPLRSTSAGTTERRDDVQIASR